MKGHADFPFGHHASRDIQDDRFVVFARNAHSKRIGGQATIHAAKGSYQDAGTTGVHEVNRNLIFSRCHQGPVTDSSQVPGVSQANDGNSLRGTLVQPDADGLFTDALT